MAYHIHHTEAFVLEVLSGAEADATFVLFTEELGLIYARATGIRYEKSKLRFALQKYSYITVDVVRGKGMWRITNASFISNAYASLGESSQMHAYAHVCGTLIRLLKGEDPHADLFEAVHEAYEALVGGQVSDAERYEPLVQARILYYLGYLDPAQFPPEIISGGYAPEAFSAVESSKSSLIKAINLAFRESQL